MHISISQAGISIRVVFQFSKDTIALLWEIFGYKLFISSVILSYMIDCNNDTVIMALACNLIANIITRAAD